MEPKKSPEADLEKKKGLFLQIGLVVSLAVTLVAFEWKSYDKVEYDLGQLKVEDVPEEIIPITKQEEKPPPPPPPPAQIINVVKDDVKIENEAEIQETEVTQETVVEVQPIKEEVIDEPEIFLIVEEMPSFPGGEGQLVKYLSENIKYPAIARENNITGTVFVTFVVGPDGSVKDVKVLRGIGGGCDEEAKRVVMAMPKWKAGKQRGESVSVQYNLPIRFTLK
ncbi:MAG: TonB family protein [Bacteroidetes bacterium]|nr:TonB family protein [Bacteroidota bacterium]